jgi:hypothetical protein
MDYDELMKVVSWSKKHHETLEDLYRDFQRDTSNDNIGFLEFSVHMYNECNLIDNKKELTGGKIV